MKRKLIVLASGLLIIGLISLYINIGNTVKSNIEIAKLKFPGSAEDALLNYLNDEIISAKDKTQIAIWSLGKIKSEKALPILYNFYKNDAKGETGIGKHDSLLCQYEIFKAIKNIEQSRLFAYSYMQSK